MTTQKIKYYLAFIEQGRAVPIIGPFDTREEVSHHTERAFELFAEENENAEFLNWQVLEIEEDKATTVGLLNSKMGF